jgi:hypothetical protein
MAHDLESTPALETLLTRLDEMAIVVGPAAAPRLGAVRELLQRALALRGRGDVPSATRVIGEAMEQLVALADHLDPGEGTLMRAAVRQFGAAVMRGGPGEMERTADIMREKSGATKVEKKP